MFTQKKSVLMLALAFSASAAYAETGPSSSQTPYNTVTAPGWEIKSLLTVGDAAGNGYKMVGIPDGLGAYSNGNNLVVLMNHELGNTSGTVRAHGSKGAFVSEWTINKNTLQVVSGADLVPNASSVYTWNSGTGAFNAGGTTSFGRLCSADLPKATAFYNPASGKGYNGRIFMNGEEVGAEGRAFGFVATGSEKGKAYELASLGKFSWENSVAHPNTGDKTIVLGTDDSTPGQVYVYVGNKGTSGNAAERAGLVGGQLYGIKVDGVAVEGAGMIPNAAFTTVNFGDVSAKTGATLQAESVSNGVTEFARPEDIAWDPSNPNVVYLATTGKSGVSAGLYKMTFKDAADPSQGGNVELVVKASDLVGADGQAARSFDNLTVNEKGEVIVQEDPGNTEYIAKTWIVDKSGKATQILEADRERFMTGGSAFLTKDEENSELVPFVWTGFPR